MRTLDQIAQRYGTDKASHKHGYCEVYEKLFSGITEPTLLEIGVYQGASIRTWCDWFPLGHIVGVDVVPDRVSGYWPGNAGVLLANATTREGVRVIAEHAPFDIIIDDGSHRWGDQQKSLEMLWPHLSPGGIYVIEDLHTSKMPDYAQPGYEPTLDVVQSWPEHPSVPHGWLSTSIIDEKLAVIRKFK